MISRERFALLTVIAIFVVLPGSLLGYEYGLRPASQPDDVLVIDLTGRLPQQGGWSQEAITVEAGQRIRIRLASDDVVHGFAIGQTDIGPVEILPGEVTEIEFVIEESGRYQFYCTRWCERDHWRMRGTLEVLDENGQLPPGESDPPLYDQLGLSLDNRPPAGVIPAYRPSASAGEALVEVAPGDWNSAFFKTTSPEEAFLLLREDPSLADYSDEKLWNLVAWSWRNAANPENLQTGADLYAANCAVCHGESGQGNGAASGYLTNPSPADFTDASRMAAANGAILQGKLVRGGMGTGMPYWGAIFTEEQQWALVDYLWSLWFDYE